MPRVPSEPSAEEQVLAGALNRQREHILEAVQDIRADDPQAAGSSFGLELHRLGKPPFARR